MNDYEFNAQIKKHLEEDYPNVLCRLEKIEVLLHEISGGVKVLRFIGWTLSALAGLWIFFQEQLHHFLGK